MAVDSNFAGENAAWLAFFLLHKKYIRQWRTFQAVIYIVLRSLTVSNAKTIQVGINNDPPLSVSCIMQYFILCINSHASFYGLSLKRTITAFLIRSFQNYH
jgi:hypothetical protein